MKLVFFGTGAFGLPALEALRAAGLAPALVVTSPDKPGGRHLESRASDVKRWALEHSIRTEDYPGAGHDACFEEVRRQTPDVLVVIAFGHILKARFLALAALAPLNVHASLLPRWRGASPIQSAILSGDAETGVSVMRMVEELDAGEVLVSKKTAVGKDETILSLEPRLAALGAQALLEGLELLKGGRARWLPQDPGRVTHCAKIRKEDGRLVWTEEAPALERRVRAFLRWPGSFASFHGKRIVVKKASVRPGPGGAPGTVIGAGPEGVLVAARGGGLLLETLQLEGRKALPAADFLNGFPLKAGDVFE